MPHGIIEHGAQVAEEVQLATDRPQTKDRRKAHMRLGEMIRVTGVMQAQGGVMRDKGETIPAIRTKREIPKTKPLSGGDDTQAGHLRDDTSMATAFEPLNMSLETFLTRLSRINERSEKSRRIFQKPRCYKDESDGCIDTWKDVINCILKNKTCQKGKNEVRSPVTWKRQP